MDDQTKVHNAAPDRWAGNNLPRKVEVRLLRGRGKFFDDIKMRGMLYPGLVRSPYYVAVDDCGTVIHPGIVEGQVYGATAYGIGAAMMESCVYDAVGNMLTSTFSDDTAITAVNMPPVKYGHIETPSPHTYSGAKGTGEGGAAPPHTISSALQDALFSEGILIEDSFNNADSIFHALAGQRGQKNRVVKVERRGQEKT